MAKIDNRRDILLLLLHSPGRSEAVNTPIAGRTRLVKMLFLFRKEALKEFRKGTAITEENFYDFFPWNFGPFSSQVYDDLNFFELRGFVARDATEEETIPESAAEWAMWLSSSQPDSSDDEISEYSEETFALTEKGLNFVEANLRPLLVPAQIKLLREFRARLEATPLRAILKYVYETYPDQIVKSTIREQVIGG